jgi:hypothetical protein
MTGSVAKRAVVVYQNQNACKVQGMTPLSLVSKSPPRFFMKEESLIGNDESGGDP